MSKKILRFSVEVSSRAQQIHLPLSAEIVHIDSKTWGFVDIWVECNSDDNESMTRTFYVVGTGVDVNDDAIYFGTTIQRKEDHEGVTGTGVWHLYERLI